MIDTISALNIPLQRKSLITCYLEWDNYDVSYAKNLNERDKMAIRDSMLILKKVYTIAKIAKLHSLQKHISYSNKLIEKLWIYSKEPCPLLTLAIVSLLNCFAKSIVYS